MAGREGCPAEGLSRRGRPDQPLFVDAWLDMRGWWTTTADENGLSDERLIALNPALAAIPVSFLEQRLAHPVQITSPLGPEALQALAQAGTHSYSVGGPAIQPTTDVAAATSATATYDAAAVARYFAQNLSRYWVAGAPGAGQVLLVQFLTAAQAEALHPAIGRIDRPATALVCYVELGGTVRREVPSQPPLPPSLAAAPFHDTLGGSSSQPGSIPSATIIFDAQTGNELETM